MPTSHITCKRFCPVLGLFAIAVAILPGCTTVIVVTGPAQYPKVVLSQAPVKGRFYVVTKGEFTLFLNQREISSVQVALAEGDIVVVKIKSRFVFRAFRLAFMSSDGAFVLPFKREHFRVLSNDLPVTEIDAAMVRQLESHPPFGRPDREHQQAWLNLDLPAHESEWIWGMHKHAVYQFAAVIDHRMFKVTDKVPRISHTSIAAHERPKPAHDAVQSETHQPQTPQAHLVDSSAKQEAGLTDNSARKKANRVAKIERFRNPVPMNVVEQIPTKLHDFRSGMTVPEVTRLLGVKPEQYPPILIMGGGAGGYHYSYMLRQGYILMLYLDITKEPPYPVHKIELSGTGWEQLQEKKQTEQFSNQGS